MNKIINLFIFLLLECKLCNIILDGLDEVVKYILSIYKDSETTFCANWALYQLYNKKVYILLKKNKNYLINNI